MGRRHQADDGHLELGLPELRPLWETAELFSEHYLRARLTRNDWWPTDDEVRPIWEFCRDLYNLRFIACARNNEAFTRQELIDPILQRLGFAWTDNLGLPESQQDLEPDYIVYPDAAAKERVIAQTAADRYRAASAVLETKKVHHPLSQISRHQGRYPHQQIRQYLDEAQTIRWGILTNGNEWRLYCRDAKPSQYFALNFEVAIKSLADFKVFYALFAPAAFVQDAQNRCRLDRVRESSVAAQTELEEDLRQRVFTLVEILANGLATRPENAIPDTPEGHRALYENCLILLYRLLFVLYAEGRRLLPVEPQTRRYYKELSLARLVGALRRFAEYDSTTRSRLHEDIIELCELINGTDERKNREYGVPRYNGGLFDGGKYPLLRQWRIADVHMAEILRGLIFARPAREGAELPLETVDYADLRVQQLGSIYEGLLEHHFARIDGRLQLVNDKAERKATGTYYTPDYIVKCIVERTVGPLLEAIEASPEVRSALAEKRQDDAFARQALRLSLLDPAMGSGHFLVEATVYLAERIAYHPTTRPVGSLAPGEARDHLEIAHWRRSVVEACIYGVDLNPLAVELAKLSLWLTTVAGDQPLNFLDHHLRCGNSLVGARLDQLGGLPVRRTWQVGEPVQTTFLFGPNLKSAVSEALQAIRRIESDASADIGAVKEKERRWRAEVLPRLAPYQQVADLWTSTYFGCDMDEETYLARARVLLGTSETDTPKRRPRGSARAVGADAPPEAWQAIAAARRFFHWELAFPEIFFNDDGTPLEDPGFDAVMGNPPYVRIQTLPRPDADYLATNFKTITGNVDLYVSFVERGLALLRRGGRLGDIVPNKFFKTEYGRGLRSCIAAEHVLDCVVDFGSEQVFPATIYTCLLFLIRQDRKSFLYANADASKEALTAVAFRAMPMDSLRADGWSFSDVHGKGLAERIRHISMRLLDLPATMSRGSSTGDDEIFLVDGKNIETGILRSPLFASDFGRYVFRPEGRWFVIFPYVRDGADYRLLTETELQQRFPRAFARLSQAREGLHKRKQCRCWYAYSAPRNLALHDKARICVPLLADRGLFALVPPERSGQLCPMASGGFTISMEEACRIQPAYVLALLNSRLLFWDLKRISNVFRGGWVTCTKQYVGELPIRRITFTTPAAKRQRLAKDAAAAYTAAVAGGDDTALLAFVDEQMQAARTDVVHDLLAFLAERMTAMNAEKHALARGFFTDLREFHNLDPHGLKPKTRLDEFWRLDTAAFFAHLKDNAKALAAQGVRLDLAEEGKLRARFQAAQTAIAPLETRIAFTDRLIDRAIYRLYDLTPAEIALVEGERPREPRIKGCA